MSWYVEGDLCTKAAALALWDQDPRYYNAMRHDWHALGGWWHQIKSCSPAKRIRVMPDHERQKLKDALRRILSVENQIMNE